MKGIDRIPTPKAALVGALLLASCAADVPHYPGPTAFETGHWRMVVSSPPTYFPRGMPRSHPTNVRDGFWICAGDSADSRFFVPTRGYGKFTRTQLEAEAKAAIHPDHLMRMARKERPSKFWYTLSSPSKGSGSSIDHDDHDSSCDDDRESRRDRGNWGSTCPPPDTCPTDPNCPAADHCPTGEDSPPPDNPNEQ